MSIAEFLDGCPSYDKRNFSGFNPKKGGNKPSPIYITTNDKPSEQIFVNDNSHKLLECLHKRQVNKKIIPRKRGILVSETLVVIGSTSRKRPRQQEEDVYVDVE